MQKGRAGEESHPSLQQKSCSAYKRSAQTRKKRKLSFCRLKNEKAFRLSVIGEKLLWFQCHLDPSKVEYTKKEACELTENYLQRFSDELEQIELRNSIKGRQARQHTSRETIIKQTMERERQMYEGYGLEIPDIMNCKHLKTFRTWDGDLQKLPNIKMRKISSKDALNSRVNKAAVEDEKELGAEKNPE
ncbi:translation machinery-associated protein 16 isoform X2 [Rhineura floridana]|uniref:translation machinery-associated protein 16 isoform X2 n=1 Tax=Rhineura floridana TaxID=261503 RepID=UPI002AC85B0C|nr:translation machinery-associated protein 16 isoform X2 [Rhineura floridana]